MSKYLDRINQDKDAKTKEANALSEAHAKASVEQRISKLTAQAATLAGAYNNALGSNPFNIDAVFSLVEEIDTNAKQLDLAKKILTTEF